VAITNIFADTLSSLGHAVKPSPLKDMQLAFFNQTLASDIGLMPSIGSKDKLLPWLLSPTTPFTKKAFAQKYGGHQFGQWNPELGDGRGVLLCEVADEKGAVTDLHLKGAGPTPYSRHADGRAVLRSTLREYIGSEALHHLGIPSSRSLAMFTSNDTVYREQAEDGAMMIRTAPSHIRFGHIEYFHYTQQKDKLDALFDFIFTHHFSECLTATNPHAALLKAIVLRTARLVSLWQTYGFVHGVMNTDNMSIHGLTFDYGPYAFMDTYQEDAVFNHSDYSGRYAFSQQPGIALWNLNALAHGFSTYCSVEEIKGALTLFEPTFIAHYQGLMVARMGLPTNDEGVALMQEFISIINSEQQDYTRIFRRLALAQHDLLPTNLRDDFVDRSRFDRWYQRYLKSVSPQAMLSLNPSLIPRTHVLEEAIANARQGNLDFAQALLDAVKTPFSTSWDDHAFSTPPPSTHKVSLSCSS